MLHFELVPDCHAVDAKLYAQHLQRIYDTWKICYPALVNQRPAFLQRDNAPEHNAYVTKRKLEEHVGEGVEVLLQNLYSKDIESSNSNLF